MKKSMEEVLSETFFNNRENNFFHTTYDEEMLQYETMKNGDPDALRLAKQMFESASPSLLSKDELTGWKYMFVASTTLCCRYCMDGGMDSETSYNLSDLYIQKCDVCRTKEEIFRVHEEMVADYTSRMKNIHRDHEYSRAVLRTIDYVDRHLHDQIHLREAANYAGVTPNYLSARFKEETGITLGEYIHKRKIEAACVFLQYYDYTITEIAEYLSFSSSSHFIKIFRELMGVTPSRYRDENFRKWK